MKIKTKHTPGPWEVRKNSEHLIQSCSGDTIASVEIGCGCCSVDADNEDKANARLISAAPCVLSAAKNALNVLAGFAVGDLKSIRKDSPAILELRAAIKKAEGK